MEKNSILTILGAILAYTVLNKQKAYAVTENPIPGEYATNMPVSNKELVSIEIVKQISQQTTPVMEPVIQPIQQPVLQEQYFYADYELPLFNIINRKPVLDIINKMVSFGGTIQDVKNIDLGAIPKQTWVNMGFDLGFSIVCSFTGPPGWIFAAITSYISWATRPDKPKKIAEDTIKRIQLIPSSNSTVAQNGIFLGLLARNRINSSMIPLIKVENKASYDQTYVTTELLPIFLNAGYINTGYAIGYISRSPFKNSCILKIMYNILLADFILVTEGSEFEKMLSAYDYIPIANLGYISTKIQKGQEGIYIQDIDQVERIQSLSIKGFEFLASYQLPSNQQMRMLSDNIKLPIKTTSLFPSAEFPMLISPHQFVSSGRITNIYAHQRDPKLPTNFYTSNLDYYNSNNLPKSLTVATLYEPVNTTRDYTSYIGLEIPPLGTLTSVVTETAGSNYSYFNRTIFINKGTDRVLIHQIDGSLLEVVLANNMNGYQKFAIFELLRLIAIDANPKIIARMLLGPYLQIKDSRALYIITDSEPILAAAKLYGKGKDAWTYYGITPTQEQIAAMSKNIYGMMVKGYM